MELYHLLAFVKVAEERNLTHAAEKMHISPSALSTQIKTLEEELGLILFHRRPRGMQLTIQGKTLISSAVEAIDSVKKFKAKGCNSRKIQLLLGLGLLKLSRAQVRPTPSPTRPSWGRQAGSAQLRLPTGQAEPKSFSDQVRPPDPFYTSSFTQQQAWFIS